MTLTEDCSVADYKLYSTSALGGYDRDFDGATLKEVAGLAVVSVAVPLDGKTALAAAVKSAFGCGLPKPALSVLSKDKSVRLVPTQADQFFAVFEHAEADAADQIAAKLGDAGYYTDQSDNWVTLALSGPIARSALERICPIDLNPEIFKVNASARTVMHHLGTLILRTGDHSYLLMSTRSSALSFVHTVETAVENLT
jgi:sarcosine oxidase subunit gamma